MPPQTPSEHRGPSVPIPGASPEREISLCSSRDPIDLITTVEDDASRLTVRRQQDYHLPIGVLDWHPFRQNLLIQQPRFLLAKDLPHAYEDNINALRQEFRHLPEMRKVFEAMVAENTAQDEPNAPPILVYNDVDSDPSPPWEFHYSNQMWYGAGVPGPDLKTLVGCDCIGMCKPRSQHCKCSNRQHSLLPALDTDFIYSPNKALTYHNALIHECNSLCSCDETCQNRVRHNHAKPGT